MKPTVTNCFPCWTEDQYATPAVWAVGDDFLCESHRRQQGLEPHQCITIEAYKAAHGIRNPAPIGDPTKFNGKPYRSCPCGKKLQHGSTFDLCAGCRRKQKIEASSTPEKEDESMKIKETAEIEQRICSHDGCGKKLISSNTSGRCGKHFYVPKGSRPKTYAKGPRKAASKPATPRETEWSQELPESAHIALTRNQLVALFTSWPIERQAAAVQAVFVQELSLA